MKRTYAALLLALIAPAAMACDLFGTKGQIGDDGQHIVERVAIPLHDQAQRYGGYQQAADFIEQNRKEIISSGSYSSEVKHQVDLDLAKNAEQLRCWAAACSNDRAAAACRM
ncbi:MAG TPA: hypothetical protein VNE00_16115 [Paraburkholderia sp.]|nr:hypothetical protein [Paraburkholderia sp.]